VAVWANGQHYLSMQYVDGEDLASLLRRIGRLPQHKAIQIARQLCAGSAAAHEQGVLHRDLKPANVMIDGRGHVRITDFGLAGLADAIEGAEVRAGTPDYMAPEQISGEELSQRSDLYALGLVLYEMLTGQRAVKGDTLLEITEFQLRREVIPPRDLNFEVPDALNQIVLKLLRRWPEDRYRSARHLIDDLIQLKVHSSMEEIDLLFGDQNQIRWEQAKKAFKTGNYTRALQMSEKVLDARPGSVEILSDVKDWPAKLDGAVLPGLKIRTGEHSTVTLATWWQDTRLTLFSNTVAAYRNIRLSDETDEFQAHWEVLKGDAVFEFRNPDGWGMVHVRTPQAVDLWGKSVLFRVRVKDESSHVVVADGFVKAVAGNKKKILPPDREMVSTFDKPLSEPHGVNVIRQRW